MKTGYGDYRTALVEMQKEGKGEVLQVDTDGITWYDYGYSTSDNPVFFRNDAGCNRDTLKEIIFCDEACQARGVTPDKAAEILLDAYDGELTDMMRVLRGIIIFYYKRGMDEGLRHFKMDKVLADFDMDDDLVGKTSFIGRMAFVNISTMTESNDERDGLKWARTFTQDFAETLIHETRHVMLDCNPVLPEDTYPSWVKTEDEVEAFARYRWTDMEGRHYIPGKTMEILKKEVWDGMNAGCETNAYKAYRKAGGCHDRAWFGKTLAEYLMNGHCGY